METTIVYWGLYWDKGVRVSVYIYIYTYIAGNIASIHHSVLLGYPIPKLLS